MAVFEGDLLIDGVSLLDYGCIVDFSGIFADAPLRGSNLTIPGLPGEVHLPKVRGAYDFSVQMTLATNVQADVPVHSQTLLKVAQLRSLLDSSAAALEMTRVRPLIGGGMQNETALGDYTSGLEPELVGFRHGRVAIVLRNISGGWTVV